MKKIVGILFFCIIMLVNVSFAGYPVELEDQELKALQNGEELANESNDEYEVIFDDVFRAEDVVELTETVDGNVYIMAETAKLDGAMIYGNVYIMAQNLDIKDCEINGSLYVLADTFTFSGVVNDIYACAVNAEIDRDSYVWRDVRAVGENIEINGNIVRNFYGSVDKLSIGSGATIKGTLEYSSENLADISSDAEIADIKFEQKEKKVTGEPTVDVTDYIYDAITVAFSTLVVTFVIAVWVNKFKQIRRTEKPVTDYLIQTCKGSVFLIIIPILAVMLICTIIGLGLGIIGLVIYAVCLCIAKEVVSVDIAYRILSKNKELEIAKSKLIGLSILVGLVIWGIGLVPAIGGTLSFLIILVGLGILFDLMFQNVKKEQ